MEDGTMMDNRVRKDRLDNLEEKVDRLGDIFRQIAVTQELMQQELKTMNNTLMKVDGIHVQLASCSTSCQMKQEQLEREMHIHLKACKEKAEECDRRFAIRDKILLGLTSSTILLMLASLIKHVTS